MLREIPGGLEVVPLEPHGFSICMICIDQDPHSESSLDVGSTYALRPREAGMIRSSPQKILAQGTDWLFFNELKRELKA